MRKLIYITTEADAGRAVRTVVPRRFQLGAHAFRRLKVQNAILLDGQPVRADHVLQTGQTLCVLLPSQPGDAQADGALIRYADADMLIVCKPAPMATLPAAHLRGDTLREVLADALGCPAQSMPYHPVNRLDKGTSGLLCVARHAHAQRLLTAQLHTDAFVREYLAVTEGVPREAQGVIDAPIARVGAGARRAVSPDGRRAVTHYAVERVCGRRALLRLRLETGRTHQIRVHLAHIGCPICGDYLYGEALDALPGRFALHSARLCCTQPVTGARVTVCAPLPDALADLLAPPVR